MRTRVGAKTERSVKNWQDLPVDRVRRLIETASRVSVFDGRTCVVWGGGAGSDPVFLKDTDEMTVDEAIAVTFQDHLAGYLPIVIANDRCGPLPAGFNLLTTDTQDLEQMLELSMGDGWKDLYKSVGLNLRGPSSPSQPGPSAQALPPPPSVEKLIFVAYSLERDTGKGFSTEVVFGSLNLVDKIGASEPGTTAFTTPRPGKDSMAAVQKMHRIILLLDEQSPLAPLHMSQVKAAQSATQTFILEGIRGAELDQVRRPRVMIITANVNDPEPLFKFSQAAREEQRFDAERVILLGFQPSDASNAAIEKVKALRTNSPEKLRAMVVALLAKAVGNGFGAPTRRTIQSLRDSAPPQPPPPPNFRSLLVDWMEADVDSDPAKTHPFNGSGFLRAAFIDFATMKMGMPVEELRTRKELIGTEKDFCAHLAGPPWNMKRPLNTVHTATDLQGRRVAGFYVTFPKPRDDGTGSSGAAGGGEGGPSGGGGASDDTVGGGAASGGAQGAAEKRKGGASGTASAAQKKRRG